MNDFRALYISFWIILLWNIKLLFKFFIICLHSSIYILNLQNFHVILRTAKDCLTLLRNTIRWHYFVKKNDRFIDYWKVHIMNFSDMGNAVLFNRTVWWKEYIYSIFLHFSPNSRKWERWYFVQQKVIKLKFISIIKLNMYSFTSCC